MASWVHEVAYFPYMMASEASRRKLTSVEEMVGMYTHGMVSVLFLASPFTNVSMRKLPNL
jgi:hypothetical protein